MRRELGGYYPETNDYEDSEFTMEEKAFFFNCLCDAIQKREWKKMKLQETKMLAQRGGHKRR